MTDWKKIADRDALEQVDLQNHLEREFTVENSRYLKKLLVETINNALGLFNEASNRKIDYVHWIDGPVALALFKETFKDTMQVKGIKFELRPFARTSAAPTLPMSSAYLRLPVPGHVKAWTIGPVEDMREMNFSHINSDIEEADWMVTLYGLEHDAVPAPSTPASHRGAYLHNQHFLHDKTMQLWCHFLRFKNVQEIHKKHLPWQSLLMKNLTSMDDTLWHQSGQATIFDVF